MKNARKPIATVLALGAVLAMPLALAQSAVTPEVREAQEAAVESAAKAQASQAAAQPAPASAGAPPAGPQLGWDDVDADGNGTISREESAALPALASVFEQADADADGELTSDEYRAHAAKAGGAAGAGGEG